MAKGENGSTEEKKVKKRQTKEAKAAAEAKDKYLSASSDLEWAAEKLKPAWEAWKYARACKYIREHLRVQPGFPEEKILFCDLCGVLSHRFGNIAIRIAMKGLMKKFTYDAIMIPESRGFLVGALGAAKLKVPIILARKPGKSPFETYEASHKIEYGEEEVVLQAQKLDFVPVLKRCHKQDRKPRILLLDDLRATGGTLIIMSELAALAGCEVAGYTTLTDLVDIPMPTEIDREMFAAALMLSDDELREIADKTEKKIRKLKAKGLI